jgi:hypothetical protein
MQVYTLIMCAKATAASKMCTDENTLTAKGQNIKTRKSDTSLNMKEIP